MPNHPSKLTDWYKFSEVHWSRNLPDGSRLDYWPTKDKFKHGKDRAQIGNVDDFIASFACIERPRWTAGELKAQKAAWFSYQSEHKGLGIYIIHAGRTGAQAASDVIGALHKALEFYNREKRKGT